MSNSVNQTIPQKILNLSTKKNKKKRKNRMNKLERTGLIELWFFYFYYFLFISLRSCNHVCYDFLNISWFSSFFY